MAEEGILGALGRIASTFVSGSPNAHQFVWGAIAPWVQELTRSATSLWLPHLVHGIPCEVISRDPATRVGVPCRGSAIAACGVCHAPCCLDHSFVSKAGAAICYPCAQYAAESRSAKSSGAPAGAAPRASAGRAPRDPPRSAPPPPPAIDPALLTAARKKLGITRRSTPDQIRQAYRQQSFRYHADRNPGNQEAARHFIEVQRAYDLIVRAAKESQP